MLYHWPHDYKFYALYWSEIGQEKMFSMVAKNWFLRVGYVQPPFQASDIKMDVDDTQRQINLTIKEANNKLLCQFSSILDSRLSTVQKFINENQKVIVKTQGPKIEQVFAEWFKFKKRVDEEQYTHNANLMAKIKEANEEMEENRIQEERQKTSEGYDLIKQTKTHKISRFFSRGL